MKIREALVFGTATALALTACTNNKQPTPNPTHSADKKSSLHFIADGNKSDVYQAINCSMPPNSADVAAETLPMPTSNASVTITLGETNDPVYEGKTKTAMLLGGATIRTSANVGEIAFSDGDTTSFTAQTIKEGQKPYRKLFEVGNYAVVFTLQESPDEPGTAEAYLTCAEPTITGTISATPENSQV